MARQNPSRDDTAHAWGMRAGIAAFATLAVVIPHVVMAEIERTAARNDRRASPAGSEAGSAPILPSLREAAARTPSAASPPASASAYAGPHQAVSAFADVPDKPWPRFLEGKGGARPAPSILAAVDAAPPLKAKPADLPWAAAPSIPPLVSKREQAPHAPLVRFDVVGPRPRMQTAKGGALRMPLLAQRHRVSTRVAFATSRPGAAQPRVPRGNDPIGDPLGALALRAPSTGPAFIMPFENGRVTSLFNQGRRHPAIDLAGRHGSPVFSTSHGQTVTFTGWRGGYGNAVITRDPQGREHLYGHLSAISTRPGVTLAQGDRLGALGSTGYSTGPHVHYEVKDRRGAHINPVTLLFPRGVATGYAWAGTGLVRGATQQAALEPVAPAVPQARADARPAPAIVRAQVGGQIRQANRARMRRVVDDSDE